MRAMGLGTNSMACWSASSSSSSSRSGNGYSTMSAIVDRVVVSDSSVKLSGSMFPSLRCGNRSDCRHISQLVKTNGKRAFLVDTLALVLDRDCCVSIVADLDFLFEVLTVFDWFSG